jgi:hypothetical protein
MNSSGANSAISHCSFEHLHQLDTKNTTPHKTTSKYNGNQPKEQIKTINNKVILLKVMGTMEMTIPEKQ